MSNVIRFFGIVKKCRNPIQKLSLSPLVTTRLFTNEVGQKLTNKQDFQDVLPMIVESVVTNPKLKGFEEVVSWTKEVLNYNLKGGKLVRGLATATTYEILEKPENITKESIQLSYIAGWCVEMAHLIMVDDLIDGSVTRRGMPCWYTLPNVQLGAVNDIVLVYTFLCHILRSYFGHMPQYVNIADLFNESLMLTTIGQNLDYAAARNNRRNYSLFTLDRYNNIVKFKTSFYTYKLPICLGMLLANNNDIVAHMQVEEISIKVGRLYQMQDDFLDVFGLESITGKFGTDIQEGKCTWLAATALSLCNNEQREIFTSSYGNSDPEHVEKIKNLYTDLDIPKIFKQEERACYDEVVDLVNKLDKSTRLPDLFLKLLNDIYRRNK